MDIRKLQRAIVDGLEDVKAKDIVVFNTEHLSPLFERVIVATGSSNRQTKALAASVRDRVKQRGMAVLRTEGEASGEWIIVDCGAAVAHIMQPAIREYYHLEEIWGGKPVPMKLGAVKTGLVKASEPAATPSKKPPAKKTAATKTAATKSATTKAAATKTPAKKAPAKKAPAKTFVKAPASASAPVAAKAPKRAPAPTRTAATAVGTKLAAKKRVVAATAATPQKAVSAKRPAPSPRAAPSAKVAAKRAAPSQKSTAAKKVAAPARKRSAATKA